MYILDPLETTYRVILGYQWIYWDSQMQNILFREFLSKNTLGVAKAKTPHSFYALHFTEKIIKTKMCILTR